MNDEKTDFSLRREEGVQLMLEADEILEYDDFIKEYKERLEEQIDNIKKKKPDFDLPRNKYVTYKNDYSFICKDERLKGLETCEETGLRCGESELYKYYVSLGKLIYNYLKQVVVVIQENENTIFCVTTETSKSPQFRSFMDKYEINESTYPSDTLVHFFFIFSNVCFETALCNYFVSAEDSSCVLYCTAHFKAAEVVVSFDNYIHFLKNVYSIIYPYSKSRERQIWPQREKRVRKRKFSQKKDNKTS